jgi:hypothetical protein
MNEWVDECAGWQINKRTKNNKGALAKHSG